MKDKWMAIFRAGDYGSKGKYTSEDLDKTVKLFNDEDKEVPITIDHIQNGPAYGWITEVKKKGDVLFAKAGKVLEEFAEVVGKGLYRKRSIEIDRDTKRLKAVTFLGAKKPEIKNLPALQFNEDQDFVTIHFEEGSGMDELERLKAENERLKAENQKFSEDVKSKEETISKLETEKKESEAKAKKEKAEKFCEEQIKAGKMLPAEKESILATFSALDDDEVVSFSEGDKEVKRTPFENFMEVQKKRPQIVNYSEEVNDPINPQMDFSGDPDEIVSFSEVEKEAQKQGIAKNDRQGFAKVAKEVMNRKVYGGSGGQNE